MPAIGVVLLDLAVQAVHVTNQSLIFAASPDAQSRLVGGYMTFDSVGSAIGAIASTTVYAAFGWTAVSLLGAGFSVAGFVVWRLTRHVDGGPHGARGKRIGLIDPARPAFAMSHANRRARPQLRDVRRIP